MRKKINIQKIIKDGDYGDSCEIIMVKMFYYGENDVMIQFVVYIFQFWYKI